MKLTELLDAQKLNAHIADRVVNRQVHPSLPLEIYNYGAAAQYGNIWDDVTVHCRGLIVATETGDIVARGFRKFFNLNTDFWPESQIANLPAEDPEITTKLDGSLGILYRYRGVTGIATRGSFMSEQSRWASRWYAENLANAIWPEGVTPLFEIIYAANRIVLRYNWEAMCLLALVDTETGEEARYEDVAALGKLNDCRVVDRSIRIPTSDLESLLAIERENEEGYVATWRRGGTSPIKVKIKLAEYCRLHRLITGISPKEIWRMMSEDESFGDLTNNVPQHYLDWVNGWKVKLSTEYDRLEAAAKQVYVNRPIAKGDPRTDRKRMAEHFTAPANQSVAAICFKMLDGQPYDDIVWKLVRQLTSNIGVFKSDE